ncbi:hypothetical protein [Tenacibaculum finnmarkense]|uniref:hypothetical protein n=2 Tax=Tenacibaculum finnmarkense TaxID=2781243 RepID=UPI000C6AF3E5|nr:hypothetical protein [Tenacibaculum finnmarkense]MCD8438947.1 hypothetical protein [Tenacibaculum finnmarkense genomovar ulcerans]WCC45597.1 hypothetical protein PJW08_06020 [Tenacibaculum finnmarkense]SOS55777.1 conserved hypothetical protein [Tenacibaculum finnmarkense]
MMTNKRISKISERIAASLILISVIFDLQDWNYGKIFLLVGLILGGSAVFYQNFIMKE